MSPDFVISQRFDLPRERMFALWTDAAQLQQWFGPAGVTVPSCHMDLRVGGHFHFCMRSPDGAEIWGKWVFQDISAPQGLVWLHSFSNPQGEPTRHPMSPTWPLELLSTVRFEEHPETGQTTVTVRWATHQANPLEQATFDMAHDSMRMGWTGTFSQLQAFIQRQA